MDKFTVFFHGAIAPLRIPLRVAPLLGVLLAVVACGAPSSSPGSASSNVAASDAGSTESSASSSSPSDSASLGAESQPSPSSESGSEAAIAPSSEAELWATLQQADQRYFVLMRHALAPGTGDPPNFQIGDCSTQRNLSEEGRQQASRTGDTFRQQSVTVDQVLSSQWCRCLETAELMELGAVESFPPLNSFFSDRSTEPDQTAQVREFMTEQNSPGVTLMVTHFVNISALSGSGVSSGEMVVMRVNDSEQLEVVGELEPL